jgi:hypothetical protein
MKTVTKYLILATLFVLLFVSQAEVFAAGTSYYVSKNGNNSTGRSWANAWNELNQIRWDLVTAGSIIYIDGGTTSMTYTTTLAIGKSGTSTYPITIRTSDETAHRGQVIIFGGRNSNLPYCGQSSYTNQSDSSMREYAITTNGYDYVRIDGRRWRGIVMTGHRVSGMKFDPNSRNITVKYVEIYNNGQARSTSSGWQSDSPGVRLAGLNITFTRAIIHDNGADAFQSLYGDNNIANFRLQESWLYNGRVHPTVNESFNYCTHTDGIQLYDGGVISGITVTETFFGPGFTQNVILGQTTTSNGSWAEVHNVTFRDVVFSRGADNGVLGYRNTESANWLLERVTIDCTGTKYNCLRINNTNHTVRYSIIYNGLIDFPDGMPSYSANCLWNTRGDDIGTERNPGFASTMTSSTSMFLMANYSVSSSSCTGSRLTSVSQLLAR